MLLPLLTLTRPLADVGSPMVRPQERTALLLQGCSSRLASSPVLAPHIATTFWQHNLEAGEGSTPAERLLLDKVKTFDFVRSSSLADSDAARQDDKSINLGEVVFAQVSSEENHPFCLRVCSLMAHVPTEVTSVAAADKSRQQAAWKAHRAGCSGC